MQHVAIKSNRIKSSLTTQRSKIDHTIEPNEHHVCLIYTYLFKDF